MLFKFAQLVVDGSELLEFVNIPSYGNLLCTCSLFKKVLPNVNSIFSLCKCSGLTLAGKQCSLKPSRNVQGQRMCGNPHKMFAFSKSVLHFLPKDFKPTLPQSTEEEKVVFYLDSICAHLRVSGNIRKAYVRRRASVFSISILFQVLVFEFSCFRFSDLV